MARLVTCVCGRRFHIGHGDANVQCRKCGRWWSGHELSGIETALTVVLVPLPVQEFRRQCVHAARALKRYLRHGVTGNNRRWLRHDKYVLIASCCSS